MTTTNPPLTTCIIAILGTSLRPLKRVSTPFCSTDTTSQAPPASGKGTLCKRAAHDPRFKPMHHVSVGDFLRGMPSGPDINGHIAAGTVLPGDEVVPILAAHISSLSHDSTSQHTAEEDQGPTIVLLDGFPRSLEQEEAARHGLTSSSLGNGFPDLAVYIVCPKNVLRDRFVLRKRGPDDEALFEKRFEQHCRECPAVVEQYRERGVLVEVDSSGNYEQSYREFVRALEGSRLASILRQQEG